jgi:hypothetical protein
VESKALKPEVPRSGVVVVMLTVYDDDDRIFEALCAVDADTIEKDATITPA